MKTVKTRAFLDRLKGHNDEVIEMSSPGGETGGQLYSISKEGCVKIWDLVERKAAKFLLSRNRNKLQNLPEENQDNQKEQKQQNVRDQKKVISAAMFTQQTVYGGFQDGLICAWNLKSGEIVEKYKGHIDQINGLRNLTAAEFVSGSKDKSIKIWNNMTGVLENTFKFEGSIDQLQTQNLQIFALIDKTYLYEIDSQRQIINRIFNLNKELYSYFQIHEKLLFMCSYKNKIDIYDLDNIEQLLPKSIENCGIVLEIKIHQGKIFVGFDDKIIRIYSLSNKFTLLDELKGHDDGITSLEFADCQLYSGSFDHSIRSWDLNEMQDRIWQITLQIRRNKQRMIFEDIRSKKFEVYNKLMGKKKKKKGGAKKGKKGKKSK